MAQVVAGLVTKALGTSVFAQVLGSVLGSAVVGKATEGSEGLSRLNALVGSDLGALSDPSKIGGLVGDTIKGGQDIGDAIRGKGVEGTFGDALRERAESGAATGDLTPITRPLQAGVRGVFAGALPEDAASPLAQANQVSAGVDPNGTPPPGPAYGPNYDTEPGWVPVPQAQTSAAQPQGPFAGAADGLERPPLSAEDVARIDRENPVTPEQAARASSVSSAYIPRTSVPPPGPTFMERMGNWGTTPVAGVASLIRAPFEAYNTFANREGNAAAALGNAITSDTGRELSLKSLGGLADEPGVFGPHTARAVSEPNLTPEKFRAAVEADIAGSNRSFYTASGGLDQGLVEAAPGIEQELRGVSPLNRAVASAKDPFQIAAMMGMDNDRLRMQFGLDASGQRGLNKEDQMDIAQAGRIQLGQQRGDQKLAQIGLTNEGKLELAAKVARARLDEIGLAAREGRISKAEAIAQTAAAREKLAELTHGFNMERDAAGYDSAASLQAEELGAKSLDEQLQRDSEEYIALLNNEFKIQNTELVNSGALDKQGLVNSGALDKQGLVNSGALDKQGLVNSGALDKQGLVNAGALDKQGLANQGALDVVNVQETGREVRNVRDNATRVATTEITVGGQKWIAGLNDDTRRETFFAGEAGKDRRQATETESKQIMQKRALASKERITQQIHENKLHYIEAEQRGDLLMTVRDRDGNLMEAPKMVSPAEFNKFSQEAANKGFIPTLIRPSDEADAGTQALNAMTSASRTQFIKEMRATREMLNRISSIEEFRGFKLGGSGPEMKSKFRNFQQNARSVMQTVGINVDTMPGGDLFQISPDAMTQQQMHSAYKSMVQNMFSEELLRRSGTAVTAHEMKMMVDVLPQSFDPDEVFEAKLDTLHKRLSYNMARGALFESWEGRDRPVDIAMFSNDLVVKKANDAVNGRLEELIDEYKNSPERGGAPLRMLEDKAVTMRFMPQAIGDIETALGLNPGGMKLILLGNPYKPTPWDKKP